MIKESWSTAHRGTGSTNRSRRAVMVLAGLSVAILLGAVLDIGLASGPFHSSVDRSYAALLASVVDQSNETAASLVQLIQTGPAMQRPALFEMLDGLVSDSQSESHQAVDIAGPLPAPSVVLECSSALADRSAEVAVFRQGVEGVLGGESGTGPVDSAASVSALQGARQGLITADSLWQSCRHLLATSPGRIRTIASQWVTGSSWSDTSMATLVQDLERSRTLGAQYRLGFAALSLQPAPLPSGISASSSQGSKVLELPPTSTLVLGTTVLNQGNVLEPAVAVQIVLQSSGINVGAPLIVQLGSLLPGQGVATQALSLPVVAGSSYTLKVSANVPVPGGVSASATWQISIAQAAPTSTTTTVPRQHPVG